MFRCIPALFALVLSITPAFAHPVQDDFAEINKKAVEALSAKKFDEGIVLLKRLFEIKPKDMGTAYNMACAYSLKNELDTSFEWMNKAVDWGWGTGQGTLVGATKQTSHVEMARTDPDLENMRKDPRFEALVKRMETRGKQVDAYASTAAVYIPEKIAQAAEMPLLVVLHDNGSTKDQVIAGRWKAIADELGTALVAPSGKTLVGEEPSKGMSWWDDVQAFQQKSWTYEKSIGDAVTAFKKEHKLDKPRVFIAGEGMGALVAFDVAVGSPGLYKGAIGLNGVLVPEMLSAKAPAAGKMGLKLALLLDAEAAKKGLPPDQQDLDKLVARWNQTLQTWGVQGAVKAFTPDAKDSKQVDKLVVEQLKSFVPAAAPVEAGASK
jgi:predicted esterase